MLKSLHSRKAVQLILGLVMGILFGFLLQKGGVTSYHVIVGQLLLKDFTVVKIMLSAVIVGSSPRNCYTYPSGYLPTRRYR